MGFWKTLGKGLLIGGGTLLGGQVGGLVGGLVAGGPGNDGGGRGGGRRGGLGGDLIAGGAHIAGAVIGSKAAKGAAKTQSTAANIAGRRQDLANQQALRYIEARRLNLPEPSPYPQAGGSLQDVSQMAPGRPGGPPQMQGGPAGYAPFSIGNTSPGGPGGSGGGQMVTVQSPTGETRQVPAAAAQRYISRGGKVVS